MGRTRKAILVGLVLATVVWAPGSAHADGNEGPVNPIAARSISASTVHTCAVLDDGSLECWGGNASGQLGYGDTSPRGEGTGPTGDNQPPVDLGTGRTALAVAVNSGINDNDVGHTCAIRDDGTVVCWGEGSEGRLGTGSTDDVGDIPSEMGNALVAVPLGADATAITAGEDHTCALLVGGSVKCWGNGEEGALGQGSTDDVGDQAGEVAALPEVPLGTGRTATAVAAGLHHTCALLDDATVKCWGSGGNGRLGYGNTTDQGDLPGEMGDALPPVALGTGLSATAIATGRLHTCAVLDDGSLKCWGFGNNGRLGHGNTNTLGDSVPETGDGLPVVPLPADVEVISPGGAHTCALLVNGEARCWGLGATGQLGFGTGNFGDSPGELGGILVDTGFADTLTVTTGGEHSCGVGTTGAVRCWGLGIDGQLGQGTTEDQGDDELPSSLPPIDLGTGRSAVPVDVTVLLTATQASVVAGQDVDYTVTVQNTGGRPLTNVRTRASEVPDCARSLPDLGVGQQNVFTCTLSTTDDDVPQAVNVVQARTAQGAVGLSAVARTPVAAVRIRPDALVRLGNGTFAGNNVYNATGTSQSRSTTVPANGTATFTVRGQNDGNTAQAFRVTGLGSTARYTVTYRQGATNVTTAVTGAGYTTPSLAPGATLDVTITIKARSGTPVGAAISRLVTVTAVADTTKKDAVKATVTRR